MEVPNWIDYVTAIGAIATPVIVLLLTAVGWKYRQSYERKIKIEEKLRDDRIEIYDQILEPFVLLLMPDSAWQSNPKNKNKDKAKEATNILLSLNYRKVSFRLSLIGSDNVVQAFNDLFKHFYAMKNAQDAKSSSNMENMMIRLGNFLLEIRKSMGNESTKLDNWSMLEWFIKDLDSIKDSENR